MPLKLFLPIYLAAYFFAAFFWRSFVVWKRTGVIPLVFKGTDSAHDYIGRVFKLLFALIVAAVAVYCASEHYYQYLAPLAWLEHRWLQLAGVILLLTSLAWTVIAQSQMGESWRIGIDLEHRTPLVRKGVFGLSRNPIFLGMMLTLAGLFLVIPNALTLLTFATGVVLIQIQVRLEEEFLAGAHGGEYAEYRRRVRRWI
ncbi:MAG TPA: isoprenylcysteine carboxylmethyltransferase family protein [Pyrinomonadaceae bacterium]|nr:isoprenylcysteine carboxylmethyltransferase family protein [Pyrinomonadaceae bacterium]